MRTLRSLLTVSPSSLITPVCVMSSFITCASPGTFVIAVHAKPGARSSSIVSPLRVHDEAVQVRIAAPPVEGKANSELVDFVQSTLELQVRELASVLTHSDHAPSVAAEAFFAGTSYAELVQLDKLVPGAHVGKKTPADAGATTKKTKKKKSSSVDREAGGVSAVSVAPLAVVSRLASGEPCPITVDLVRGSTSKTKSLAVQFPGSEAELVGLLQRSADE